MSITTPVPYVYQSAPLVTDPSVIKQNMINYLIAYMPAGWRLASGSLLDLTLEAVAIQAAQQADVAQQKLDSDFRYFGTLVNLPPIDAISATTNVTFTVQDTNGYTIPAGAVVGVVDSSGTLQGFDTTGDLTIPVGQSTGTIVATAEQAGTVCNGLGGGSVQIISAPGFVTAATMTTASNGIDAETDPDFLNRLTETLGLLTPIPVLGTNFAVLARGIAGVYRACGVNLLKPGPPYDTVAESDTADKNVTVAVTDINGADPGATIRGNVQTYLNSLREANFKVWCVAAQYQQVDVAGLDVYYWQGWDPTDVQTRVNAALAGVLNPATFATDPSGNAARWADDPIVHASALTLAAYVPGVRNVANLSFGIHGGAMGSTDVTLGAGSAIPALPTTGTITTTMHATTS